MASRHLPAQARKIEDVPFPWPYAQMVAFLLLTFSVTFPLMVASQMAQLPEQGLAVGLERPAQSLFERGIVEWTPPLLTFLTIMGARHTPRLRRDRPR